ncbi:unnamed protein product [Heligmosomoides polygyrus]|uniref:Helix-turn-helix domain-containing protein n=1 Tax=Heligmosomoides polygyrus TaxID=6339 RepID=A0A183FHS9_HELPZ|nr:unnamed protein product [Heligmosomoides polygyrus]
MEKLYIEGVRYEDIARLGIAKSAVYSNLNRQKENGAMEDRPRSGRSKTAFTSDVVKEIREKVRKSRRSMRELSHDKGISKLSI